MQHHESTNMSHSVSQNLLTLVTLAHVTHGHVGTMAVLIWCLGVVAFPIRMQGIWYRKAELIKQKSFNAECPQGKLCRKECMIYKPPL